MKNFSGIIVRANTSESRTIFRRLLLDSFCIAELARRIVINNSRGQALITLIFFVLISITITSGAVIMIIVNATSLGKLQEGTIAYDLAETGVENAALRLVRDPNYLGETLPKEVLGNIPNTKVEITVTGSNPKTITAVGTNGNFKRTVRAQMNYSSGSYSLSEWKEI